MEATPRGPKPPIDIEILLKGCSVGNPERGLPQSAGKQRKPGDRAATVGGKVAEIGGGPWICTLPNFDAVFHIIYLVYIFFKAKYSLLLL